MSSDFSTDETLDNAQKLDNDLYSYKLDLSKKDIELLIADREFRKKLLDISYYKNWLTLILEGIAGLILIGALFKHSFFESGLLHKVPDFVEKLVNSLVQSEHNISLQICCVVLTLGILYLIKKK